MLYEKSSLALNTRCRREVKSRGIEPSCKQPLKKHAVDSVILKDVERFLGVDIQCELVGVML